MAKYDVTFTAGSIECTERIEATSKDEARQKAEDLALDHEVGEHKLDIDWDIDTIVLVETAS